MTLPQKNPSDEIYIQQLKQKIARLEQEKSDTEKQINQFQSLIRSQLHHEIEQVSALTELYKQHKKAKKEKRLEQKRNGKNYVAPKPEVLKPEKAPIAVNDPETQSSLKKLYKEAVILVHPDKVDDQNETEKIKQASDLTAQLNNIYKSGDLEELSYFYHHVILSKTQQNTGSAYSNPTNTQDILLQKKKRLSKSIYDLQQSYIYHVLSNYENPNDFLVELKHHFSDKIQKLKKRTRKLR